MALIPLFPFAEFWRGSNVFLTCKLASLRFDALSGMGLLQTLGLANILDTVTECIRLLFFSFFLWYFFTGVSREAPEAASKNHYFTRGNSATLQKYLQSLEVHRAGSRYWSSHHQCDWLLLCMTLSSACDVTTLCTGSLCIRSLEHVVFSCSQSKNIIYVCHFNGYIFYLHVFVHSTQPLLE